MADMGEWRVPGYSEVRELGAGGGGRVVLATHVNSGTPVAIKYLSEALRDEPGFLARFQEEARVMVELADPHVARLYEYRQTRYGGAAIVMELVNGVSLRAILREHGATGPEAALSVLKGSLLGLAAAHRLGVVHRDYKPENVLVQGDGTSKLVDFGIAVRSGDGRTPAGTPPYMAPEQWSGLAATPATDVYAATAVFFECLTGHRPYQATAHVVLKFQHEHAPVPIGEVPEPVRGLVARGLAKDPLDRPPGAAAFLAELERVARAAYGEDWEERGRRRLAELAALLVLLFPLHAPAPPPTAATSLFRTVLGRARRAVRDNAARIAAGAGVVVVAGGATAYVLAADEPPTRRVDIVAAAPTDPPTPAAAPATEPPAPTPFGTPATTEPALAQSPPAETPTAPETAQPETTQSETTPPETTPPVTTSPPTTSPPTTSPPTTFPPTTSPPTSPPVTTAPPTRAPAPTRVSAVRLGELSQDGEVLAVSTTVTTRGSGRVRLTVAFAVNGTVVDTQRMELAGATTYVRAFQHALAEPRCGGAWTVTATTEPAAPGGTVTASRAFPDCPTSATGVRVAGLSVDAAPGRTLRARFAVTASGTGRVPVTAEILSGGSTVATRSAVLSGRRSYTRTLTHAFPERPCGTTVGVRVKAGAHSDVRQVRVTCPAGVQTVEVLRAAVSARGATATVRVVTDNDRPVRLRVVLQVGDRTRTSALTLSGATSYTRTLSFALGTVPCGQTWQVSAATTPAARGGADTLSGRTAACPPPREPAEPSPSASAPDDPPPSIR